MTTWVPIFDTADTWPADPAAVWALGYRAFAAYAGSQAWKAVTPARLRQWMQPAHPYALAPMFESVGNEPVTSPNSGTAHARAARAAWTALGVPAHVAISYPVDRNVTMAQIKGPVARYFELVLAAEGFPQIAYIEQDGADWLTTRGLIAGGFTPAAASWGDPPILVTPATAGPHILWTQEHNATPIGGARVDAGHIRTTAPIWWPANTPLEDDMSADDVLKARVDNVTPPAADGQVTVEQALRMSYYRDGYLANTFAPAMLAAVKAMTPASFAAALAPLLVADLPAGTVPTEAELEQAFTSALGKLTATTTVTVAP